MNAPDRNEQLIRISFLEGVADLLGTLDAHNAADGLQRGTLTAVAVGMNAQLRELRDWLEAQPDATHAA